MNFIPLTFYSLSFFMIGAYVYIVIEAIRGIKKTKTTLTSDPTGIAVDVIIAYHNEIENLPGLLESFKAQTYPNFRVIWVNDNSNDGSDNYIKSNGNVLPSLFINNPETGKKSAINNGIKLSDAEFIVFTDADCTHHPKWLENYARAFKQYGDRLYFGPVNYTTKSFLENIFNLEFTSLMGTGMGLAGSGKPAYMNGANYAISRNLLHSHNDKNGTQYASGDDVFLLHHIKKEYSSTKIYPIINNEILVKTESPKSVAKFIKQRIRWGGKTTGYKDLYSLLLAAVVFIFSSLQIMSLFLLHFSIWVLLIWPIKAILDFITLHSYKKIWPQRQFWGSFVLLIPFYPFYIVSAAIIGLLSDKKKW